MTRYEAREAIYEVINSGILNEELEERLTEVAECICDNDFETCPQDCLRYCKKDECENAELWEEETEY